MNHIFAALQHTYDGIELALFRGPVLLSKKAISKFKASSMLIPILDESLKEQNLTLTDLAFMAANYGPGPFTTLRTVIASLNGIAFTVPMPLVGVDGLKTFMSEYEDAAYNRTVIMLNAFNHDVYFAYNDTNGTLITGAQNGEQLLRNLAPHLKKDKRIRFIGNAVSAYHELITELFADRAYIPDPLPQTCSVERIGLIGYEQWQNKINITDQLVPQYLKTQEFKKSA